MKKGVFAVVLLAAPIFAQNLAPSPVPDQAAAARASAGCGPNEIKFDVKTDKHQHPTGQPDTGKALVYVFGDTFMDNLRHIGGLTTRVGLDGKWIGANDGKSYFFFQEDPGDHRLCTSWQSMLKSRTKVSAALSVTLEAGKSYYFRTKTPDRPNVSEQVELAPVDPAAAQLLIANSAFSTSQSKK